jgi:predicted RNA methylase
MSEPSVVERCLSDPGYTPSRHELPALLAGLAELDGKAARRLERVLVVNPAVTAEVALALLANESEALRRALYSVLGRIAVEHRDARFFPALAAGLEDPSPRARRAAVMALGKLGDARAEPLLLALLETAEPALLRSVVDTLGKVGTRETLAALDRLAPSDAELERRRTESRLLVTRRLERGEPARLEFDRALPAPERIAFSCRRGLAPLLCRELARLTPREHSATRVEIERAASIAELLGARTALGFGIVAELETGATPLDQRIANALARPETLAALQAWTQGPARFRLEWEDGAHHRALTWSIAERVLPLAPALLNDPRAANWVVLASPRDRGELLLCPRLSPDPRFAYRRRDVPAASHPTIAAALAQSVPLRADDVIWDPFVGSGLELIERARLGPYRRLLGSDLDARALEAARENASSAGVRDVEFVRGDALTLEPEGVTLILSNPPLGRRVARDGSVKALLAGFVAHAGRLLKSGGRLVWLSPFPRHTEAAARSAGFDVDAGPAVDMGGFDAHLQMLTKR